MEAVRLTFCFFNSFFMSHFQADGTKLLEYKQDFHLNADFILTIF